MADRYGEVAKRATLKYMKNNVKSINIRIRNKEYEDIIQPAIERSGLPTATFIKLAIHEKIERDGLSEGLPETDKNNE